MKFDIKCIAVTHNLISKSNELPKTTGIVHVTNCKCEGKHPTVSHEPCGACGETTEPRGYFYAPRSACLDGLACTRRQKPTRTHEDV